jgi:hypothetical protein
MAPPTVEMVGSAWGLLARDDKGYYGTSASAKDFIPLGESANGV